MQLEEFEKRILPALIASQVPLVVPTLQGGANNSPAIDLNNQVQTLLERAAAATVSDDAIVAVVDRSGNILGVRVEGNVSPQITSNPATLDFAIDGAVAEARAGAYFSSDGAPLTSRTVQFLSESTILQREVDSSPYSNDPTTQGPGVVAPIEIGGDFPPGVDGAPSADLFEIELTNRDGSETFDPSTGLEVPYGIDPNFATAQIPVSGVSYAQAIDDPAVPNPQSRGIGTLPGGIPIYEDGELVGGIGVFFPGTTGYASAENSSLSADYNPSKPDLSLEAEFVALAAIGGSSGAGLPVGTLGGIPALPGFDLPFDRIDLGGITLPGVGPGGQQGPHNLVAYAQANLGVGQGNPFSGMNVKVNTAGTLFMNGVSVPSGWLVLPHDGVGITAADVQTIIEQGIAEANQTRSQLRLPLGTTASMVFAVADSTGEIVGLYRMPDAPVFSIDVAVAKARNTAYYDDPNLLQSVDQVPGLPDDVAMTNRTFRYLAQPYFPEGIQGAPPGPFSILSAPGINPLTGLDSGAPLPASDYDGTVVGYAAFNPNTNFHATNAGIAPSQQNGIVFFPGSSGVYTNQQIVGGFGVSGDGVNQDDFITAGGIAGFGPPSALTADQFTVDGVRLPYMNFPRNPTEL